MAEITFLNHASIFLSTGSESLLTDPWYSGSVFHEGWLLVQETPPDVVLSVLESTDFIWISHEHPDHFSPAFFKRFGSIIRDKGIRVLFQETIDGRVRDFLRSQDIPVMEMENETWIDLSETLRVKVVKSEFYDSALIAEVDGIRVFNLNDCPMYDADDLKRFFKRHGACDILLTQFSYAAWKGGPANRRWRCEAAAEKIAGVRRQAEMLEAKTVLPFASYAWFANELNFYLNDSVNTPRSLAELNPPLNAKVVVLRPLENQALHCLEQDPASLKFWEDAYDKLPKQAKLQYANSVSIATLRAHFYEYRKRTLASNSEFLIRCISRMRLLGGFQPLVVHLVDHDRSVRLDVARGVIDVSDEDPDVEMHSESLNLIFRSDFGFDTLTVNGCFAERKMGGFPRMTKCLALGNLNNLGIRLSWGLIFNPAILLMFMRRLRKVAGRLRPAD